MKCWYTAFKLDPVRRQGDVARGLGCWSGFSQRLPVWIEGVSESRIGVAQKSQSHTNHTSSPAVGSDTPQPLTFQPQTSQFPGSVGKRGPGKCPVFIVALCLWFMDSLTVQPEIPHRSETVILEAPR